MPLNSSTALMTPSRLSATESDSEPEEDEEEIAPAPAERTPDESKLSPKQKERLEKLLAAVKSEFKNLLEEEKRKPQG